MIWIEIIIFVLKLILSGIEKEKAIEKASNMFDVSMFDIRKHL